MSKNLSSSLRSREHLRSGLRTNASKEFSMQYIYFFCKGFIFLLYLPRLKKKKGKQPDQWLISHVLRCGNCFIVDPAWCFAAGTLYSCACVVIIIYFFFPPPVDYTTAPGAGGHGRIEAACAHFKCSFIYLLVFLRVSAPFEKEERGKRQNVKKKKNNPKECRLTSRPTFRGL